MDGLIRRFDVNGNGVVSYSEFVDAIMPTEPFFIQKLSTAGSRSRAASPAFAGISSPARPQSRQRIADEPAMISSLLHSASKAESPQRASSPLRPSPRRAVAMRPDSLEASPLRLQDSAKLSFTDSTELARLFDTQMRLQRQVECAKERLAI